MTIFAIPGAATEAAAKVGIPILTTIIFSGCPSSSLLVIRFDRVQRLLFV